MQVIFHTGAHGTDEERLLKCLLRNKEDLAQRGVSVPGPGRYRYLLKDAFKALQTAAPSPDARDVLIDAILDDEVCDRLVLSNAHFFGSQRFALIGGQLYPDAAERMSQLQKLFRFEQIEMFMAIRNPATFLPAIIGKVSNRKIKARMGDADPREIRWSDMVLRVREAVPDVALTIWCNEDTPLIWAQIIREVAGLEPGDKVIGALDLVNSIMSKEGIKRLNAYLAKNPEMPEVQQRRVIAAFLDKFADEDKVEEVLDMPGWTDDLVDELTDIYDEDVFRISRIPGVQLIAP
jgi:hypothetical protein